MEFRDTDAREDFIEWAQELGILDQLKEIQAGETNDERAAREEKKRLNQQARKIQQSKQKKITPCEKKFATYCQYRKNLSKQKSYTSQTIESNGQTSRRTSRAY